MIEEGSYFGEIGCIMGGIRRAGVKALSTCELQALSRRNLNILLGEYPEVGDELKRVARDRASIAKKGHKEEEGGSKTSKKPESDAGLTHEHARSSSSSHLDKTEEEGTSSQLDKAADHVKESGSQLDKTAHKDKESSSELVPRQQGTHIEDTQVDAEIDAIVKAISNKLRQDLASSRRSNSSSSNSKILQARDKDEIT